MSKGISSLWKNEDWWAIWFGFIAITVSLTGLVNKIPKIGKWTDNPIDSLLIVKGGVTSGNIALPLLLLMLAMGVLTTIGVAVMKAEKPGKYFLGFLVIFILSCIAYWVANQTNIKYWGLSYALWAL